MLYDWFNAASAQHVGKLVLPQFIYARNELLKNITTIVDYYQEKAPAVPNEHLLVRLIEGMNISMGRDVEDYVQTANDQILFVGPALQLTTPNNYGFVFNPGVFYNNNTHEIILTDDTDFDIPEAIANWRSLKPIRVLRSPFTDLSMARLDGNYKGSPEAGVAVFSINVGMLMLQYREWYKNEWKESKDPRHSTHQFIARFPLTNLIYSHIDVCVFNRMVKQFYISVAGKGDDSEDQVMPFSKRHPFYIIDVTSQMDTVLIREIAYLKRKSMTFDQILEFIPAICVSDLQAVIKLPHVIPTRQITWALIVARLALLDFLVKLNVFTNNPANSDYTSRISTYLKAVKSSRTLDRNLPGVVKKDIEIMLNNMQAFV